MTPEIAARLQSFNIQLVAEGKSYSLFSRGEVAAMVQLGADGRFTPGSSGMMTDNGLAYLLWRGPNPILAAHGGKEIPATPEQAEEIQRFSADLKNALGWNQ